MTGLQQLDDDVLICIFGFLPVTAIVILRQTCRRLAAISRLHFVWQQACIDQVLLEGLPFPDHALATADALELTQLVIRALHIGAFWLAPSPPSLPCSLEFRASTGTGVSDLRFLPGHGGRYLLTVYKGIWSMITCWDVGFAAVSHSRRVADWCPKNTIFSGFVVNTDPESEALLAIAVQHGGDTQSIEVLSIIGLGSDSPSFQSVCNIDTSFRPIALKGNLIAFSDDASDTVVMDWRNNTSALLKGSQQPIDNHFQYNRCLQVIFAFKSTLVIRARSVELFPELELRPPEGGHATYQPIGFHTFGWIDGVAVTSQTGPRVFHNGAMRPAGHEPLSILLRAESDDPWASDVHKLEQFVLFPNPAFDTSSPRYPPSPGASKNTNTDTNTNTPPYLFPPARAEHTSPTARGVLRCRDIALGPCGTALWIQPRAARTAHLTGLDVHASATQFDGAHSDYAHPDGCPLHASGSHAAGGRESLCAAVFAGPLQRRHPGLQSRARTLWVQSREGCNWTTLDYDEEAGRVALGSTDGRVTVLDLVLDRADALLQTTSVLGTASLP